MTILKKSIIPFFICLSTINISFSQNYNWITPNKTYLKLYVTENGMYRINKTDFTDNGINVAKINPRTVKVLYNGAEIPVYFKGESDGIFNDSDYIDFYGKRNAGGNTITYNDNNTLAYTTNEYFNQYSDTNFYFIGWDGVNGLRYTETNFTTGILFSNNFYFDNLHFEYDKFYSQGENISSNDYRFLTSEKFRGEGWYWKYLADNQSVSDTFSVPALYNISQNATIKLFAFPTVRNTSVLNEHKLEVRVNGNLVTTLLSNDFNRFDTTVTFPSSLLSSASVNNVTVTYVPAAGTSGAILFDFFKVSFPKFYKFRSEKLSANTGISDTTSKLFKVSSFNTSGPLNIYDNFNNYRISVFTSVADTLKFTGKSNGNFEIVNNFITKKPARIKQRSVPDLASNLNGADYLIVYNKLFTTQAEQLRDFRQSRDNFRSVKAEIEDIYDIFNYGIENPIAVKNFTKHIYDTWQLPKLKYICLFGRGSTDPKKNLPTSAYYKNLIPIYGYPNTDGYFSNFKLGTFYYYSQVAIGRLPVYSVSEAQAVVNKIISYENEQPDNWWKIFTFITGGGTYIEQQTHQQRSNFEISSYLTPPNISANSVKIYRTDSSGANTFNVADSVVKVINRGTSLLNFRGHAGSHDWEVVMRDPNTLSNRNKLPLIQSLTCFTGENAKADFRGFGERFLYLPDKGAIGFVGTTGWSFGSQGNNLGTIMLQAMKFDTLRRIGDLLKFSGVVMGSDSSSFNVRHTVNCYNLIGDPAVKFILPSYPEFAITNNDYKISDNAPNVKEITSLHIYPKNFGLFADSCKIRFQLKKNNINYSFRDTVYKSFRFLDTVKYNFVLDSAGIYDMVVTLDIDNRFTKEIETNNSITINIPTKNTTFIPISPIDNSITYRDSVEFTGLNPNFDKNQGVIKVFLEMDTAKNFSSPVKRTFIKNEIKGAVTKFKSDIPVLLNNTLYYWRTSSFSNNDTTDWSKVQTFIYHGGIGSNPEEMKIINSEIRADVRKFKPSQFNEADLSNTNFFGDEIKLSEFPATLFVRSYGNNGEEASFFSVGNQNVYIDAGLNSGLNLLKVKKLSGNILSSKNFRMNSSGSSDSLVTFLNSFDTTQYLMLLNASYVPGGTVLNTAAKNKLRQFGSIYCDSISLLGYFHTWSFIGYLGANNSQVAEMYDPCCRIDPTCTACDHWTESVSRMNVTFKKSSGTVSNIIGPAQTWTSFSWIRDLPVNSDLSFDVIGIDKNNAQTLLMSNLRTDNFSDLNTINAVQYPKLNLLAKLSVDTATGVQSPSLNYLRVNYTPAAELILIKNTFTAGPAKAKKDAFTGISFDYFNAGYSNVFGTIVNVFAKSISDSNLIFTDTINSILKTDSLKTYSSSFKTPVFNDSTRIVIYIKPKNDAGEFYTFNNILEHTLNGPKISNPNLTADVYSDGKKLNSGDKIRKNPELKINIYNDKYISILTDTNQIILKINESYIPYFLNGKRNSAVSEINPDNTNSENGNSLLFYPEFKKGNNKFTVIYKNNSQISDTLNFDINISDDFSISDLYNFPNPMKTETNFIFKIDAADNSGNSIVKIYTTSGKIIREIKYPLSAGINQIAWDGKDSDGDFIANGTYLYKLIIDNESKTESKVQKLVVLR